MDKRGRFLTGLAAFWMVGSVLAAALAWLILAPTVSQREREIRERDERERERERER